MRNKPTTKTSRIKNIEATAGLIILTGLSLRAIQLEVNNDLVVFAVSAIAVYAIVRAIFKSFK